MNLLRANTAVTALILGWPLVVLQPLVLVRATPIAKRCQRSAPTNEYSSNTDRRQQLQHRTNGDSFNADHR